MPDLQTKTRHIKSIALSCKTTCQDRNTENTNNNCKFHYSFINKETTVCNTVKALVSR